MDKPIYDGFTILYMRNLHLYETWYDNLQPHFRQENLQIHYVDTDGMILSMRTKNIIKDFKNLEDVLDFSNLNGNHELYSNKNKKVIGNFEIETPENVWINELVCLRSEVYAFTCGDESKIKLKEKANIIRKILNLRKIKKCLDGEEYEKECDNYILRTLNHEMYLQEIKKSSLSTCHDKRCYINESESIPWN